MTPRAVPAVFDVSHCQKLRPPAVTFVRPNFRYWNASDGVVVLLSPMTVPGFSTATGTLLGAYGIGARPDSSVEVGALPRHSPRIRAGSAPQTFTLLSAVSKNTGSNG